MRCFNSHIAILYVQMVDNQRKSTVWQFSEKRRELPYIVIVRISTLIFVATYQMLRRDAVVVTSRCIRCYVGT